ncbi:hypothetical protein NPIL_224171 [Nephila pilipes]|uniref:Uncharacterized protein n=1 Tax=Nephila pilipes TaxID=299642 RepID=A0A8X6NNR8_NEPPI|nr:hypothetical protein NPIL_224171 [Nephila pilipes]
MLPELLNYMFYRYCTSKSVEKEGIQYGSVSKYYAEHISCSILYSFKCSPVFESYSYDCEINTSIIYDMLPVGIGLCGIKTFCTGRDLSSPVSQSSCNRVLNNVKSDSSFLADDLMKKAVIEEITASKTNEICVYRNGT